MHEPQPSLWRARCARAGVARGSLSSASSAVTSTVSALCQQLVHVFVVEILLPIFPISPASRKEEATDLQRMERGPGRTQSQLQQLYADSVGRVCGGGVGKVYCDWEGGQSKSQVDKREGESTVIVGKSESGNLKYKHNFLKYIWHMWSSVSKPGCTRLPWEPFSHPPLGFFVFYGEKVTVSNEVRARGGKAHNGPLSDNTARSNEYWNIY